MLLVLFFWFLRISWSYIFLVLDTAGFGCKKSSVHCSPQHLQMEQHCCVLRDLSLGCGTEAPLSLSI